MGFLRRNYFGIIIVIFILLSAMFFTIIIISPKEDTQKRGFVMCTEKFVTNASQCKDKAFSCISKHIWYDFTCNLSVISDGFSLWVSGEQEKPWSNYIYEPDLLSHNIDLYNQDGIETLYEENPNILEDMQQVRLLNKEMEKKDE